MAPENVSESIVEAVIIPATNPPLASLETIVFPVLVVVAVVALLGMFVSDAPDPLNTVAPRVPVEAL